jgi:hypothetical protein
MGVVGVAGAAHASEILVTADITTSTTWTSGNTYNLQTQIYVDPGATLTIEAGTIVASDTNIGGSLAVCKGAQIFVQGTQFNPVIMTSKADVATWTGGDPKTGTWRAACNEWGNLTIMGGAYVSTNQHAGNVATPDAANRLDMEGLTPQFIGDTRQQCGGGDDDDDTGTITFLSLRYGGKVVSLGNELNGMSVGAIGRGTTIHHIDIMNNVDDGIETWGGTVNYKYLNIWNIGDDAFDFDCGWRGKAQFGLLVLGYSVDAARGSGSCDNAFEMDGAEDSDWQPVSTNVIDNFTAIGQPLTGRRGSAWRDDDRTQFHNCIFMDFAEQVVHNDVSDGDHCTPPGSGGGYGMGGSLNFVQTWATAYTSYSTVNAPANPADFYKSQTSGNLAEIKDTVFFRNQYVSGGTNAYTDANSVNVFDPSNNNVQVLSILDADAPIQSITRGAPVSLQGGTIIQLPVIGLDPRPKNDALTSVEWAPADGFFDGAHYRGGFAPGNSWLHGWTACEAFGFTATDAWTDRGQGLAGVNGNPVLSGTGDLSALSSITVDLSNANPSSNVLLVLGLSEIDAPALGGTLVPSIFQIINVGATDGSGNLSLGTTWPTGVPSGFQIVLQEWVFDGAGPKGFAASNGLVGTTP